MVNGPIAQLPIITIVRATNKGTIFLHPEMPEKLFEVLIFPHLQKNLLISVGQICDNSCIVFFTKENFFVIKNDTVLLNGSINKTDGL